MLFKIIDGLPVAMHGNVELNAVPHACSEPLYMDTPGGLACSVSCSRHDRQYENSFADLVHLSDFDPDGRWGENARKNLAVIAAMRSRRKACVIDSTILAAEEIASLVYSYCAIA